MADRAAAIAASASPDPDYQSLWNALGHDPTGMDQLVARTGLTAAELSSMLLVMELDGRVASQHGRYFRIVKSLAVACKSCPPRRMRRRPREMKESILDVLLYLFEHYFTDDADLGPRPRLPPERPPVR